MIKVIAVYVIWFVTICSAEECFKKGNWGILSDAMAQHSDKITDLSIFQKYEIITNPHGTTEVVDFL